MYGGFIDVVYASSDPIWESEVRSWVLDEYSDSEDSSLAEGACLEMLPGLEPPSVDAEDFRPSDWSGAAMLEGRRFGPSSQSVVGTTPKYIANSNLHFEGNVAGSPGTWIDSRLYGCQWGRRRTWVAILFRNFVHSSVLNVKYDPRGEHWNQRVRAWLQKIYGVSRTDDVQSEISVASSGVSDASDASI